MIGDVIHVVWIGTGYNVPFQPTSIMLILLECQYTPKPIYATTGNLEGSVMKVLKQSMALLAPHPRRNWFIFWNKKASLAADIPLSASFAAILAILLPQHHVSECPTMKNQTPITNLVVKF